MPRPDGPHDGPRGAHPLPVDDTPSARPAVDDLGGQARRGSAQKASLGNSEVGSGQLDALTSLKVTTRTFWRTAPWAVDVLYASVMVTSK